MSTVAPASRELKIPTSARPYGVTAVLLIALVLAVTLAVSLGPLDIPAGTVWTIVAHKITGLGDASGWTVSEEVVVWQVRLPRALLAVVVGAGLGIVGAVVQALVRNPLADPYLLGISSGASLGAVTVIVYGGAGALAGVGLPTASFAGALLAFGLVWLIARRGGGYAPMRLVLGGVAVGQLLAGLTSFVILRADDEQQTKGILFWMLGSLGGTEWRLLPLPVIGVTLGLLALLARSRPLNALLMGDETAAGLGVDVARLRRELFVVTSALTALMVSVSGAIGFVGLMVPHVVRLLAGTEHRKLLPLSALTGAVLLVAVDVVARTALEPEEIPIGIVTALIGAPLFLYLLDRRLERR
ncbi:FecCD family ABC transporter permease [Rhizohabitans arisaemae]|uniref:FecCD family ABC transporter permease n=1 Tax=Rhizohabitans arisaemae TaxID=2720610 RepID=UPI0024B14077|nr:iron ABC transporter permease [Rhizohabitans arisaemae]